MSTKHSVQPDGSPCTVMINDNERNVHGYILCFWCPDVEKGRSSSRVVVAKVSQRRRFVNVNAISSRFKVLRPPVDDTALRGDTLARCEASYLLGDQFSAPHGKLPKAKISITLCFVSSVVLFCLFSLTSSGYQLGCTVAAVSAQRPVEHVTNN